MARSSQKTVKPDDANLVDVFARWIDRTDWQQQVFVNDPSRLYGFD